MADFKITPSVNGTNVSLSTHNHSLDTLSNVTITDNTAGEILKWNGTTWVNNTLAEASVAAASHTHTLSNITDAGNIASINKNGSTSNYLRGDGTWVTPYSPMSVAEGQTGTATSPRTMRADYLKQIVEHRIANTTPATHTHSLNTLSNVTITDNTAGEILKWNGTAWVNNTLEEAGIQPAGSYLTGNQTITLSGDATGSGTTSISLTLANSGVTAGTYKSVTVDAKGRVTNGTNPTTLSGYGITDAASSTHNHSLDSLSNVTITANTPGEILKWNGTTWVNNTLAEAGIVSGSTLSNETASANTFYPVFASTTSGAMTTAYTSDTKLTYQPSTGTLSAVDVAVTSDQSKKDNIKPIEFALDKVLCLNGVYFTWKDSGENSLGLIAQEVEQIIPEVVHVNHDTGIKSLSYGNLVGLLIEAIKDQQQMIENLQTQIDSVLLELNNK